MRPTLKLQITDIGNEGNNNSSNRDDNSCRCKKPEGVMRGELPSTRRGYTQRFSIGGQTVYLRTGEYEDGTLGEIFIDANKTGTFVRAALNAFAMAISRGLQYGIPLEEFITSFKGIHFEPCGDVTGDPRITEAESVIDYIFKELEMTYVSRKLPVLSPQAMLGSSPRKTAGAVTIGSGA